MAQHEDARLGSAQQHQDCGNRLPICAIPDATLAKLEAVQATPNSQTTSLLDMLESEP